MLVSSSFPKIDANVAALRQAVKPEHIDYYSCQVAASILAIEGNLEENLRGLLDNSDTACRDLILYYIHPIYWKKLGFEPLDYAKSAAAYATRFGAA